MGYVKRIKFIMFLNDWSQKDLSKKSGLTESFLCRMLSGKVTPKIETLRQLSAALSVPLIWLLEEEDIFSPLIKEARHE